MSQNTSHAVMAQRAEPSDSLDFFPTPPWATRALCEHVLIGAGERRDTLARQDCHEPACGQGHMSRPLAEYFNTVLASDCHGYGAGQLHDFLMPGKPLCRPDWIITNPPFRLAQEFVLRGLDIARAGVAMLVRTVFIESARRHAELFSVHPPSIFAPFVERVVMAKGRLLDPKKLYPVFKNGRPVIDTKTGQQKMRRPSTATSYCWIVWQTRRSYPAETIVRWIPPCRKRLEKPEDYA